MPETAMMMATTAEWASRQDYHAIVSLKCRSIGMEPGHVADERFRLALGSRVLNMRTLLPPTATVRLHRVFCRSRYPDVFSHHHVGIVRWLPAAPILDWRPFPCGVSRRRFVSLVLGL